MTECTYDEAIRIPAGFADLEAFRRWWRSADYPRTIKVSYLTGDLWIEAPDTTGKGLHIPAGVTDHESFRRWARSGDIPEHVRVCYLDGDLWVDLSMEQLYTHNRVKTRFTTVLDGMAEGEDLGQFFSAGIMLTLRAVRHSTVPDGTFVSYGAFQAGRVRRVEDAQRGYVELEGPPDIVLEVVSANSVHKDTVELRMKYWQAGIPEYWLVDARVAPPRFDLLRRGSKGYVRTRPQADGWLKSLIFSRSFRLTQTKNRVGDPQYKLDMRA